jgi:hypothetical protein
MKCFHVSERSTFAPGEPLDMMPSRGSVMKSASVLIAAVFVSTVGGARPAAAQATAGSIDLVVKPGVALRIALDQRITVKRVGQEITGTLVADVYAYDRVVFPAGVHAAGHIERFEEAPRMARLRAMIGGSFSTLRHAIVRWDAFVLDDGRRVPIDSVVTGTPGRMRRQVAGGTESADTDHESSIVARARDEIGQEIKQRKAEAVAAINAIKEPGKIDRLKEMVIDRLPYHPQYLSKGAVFNASLLSPVTLGPAAPIAVAAAGALPAPESILTARLVTPLDSARTPKGTPMEAVVTTPVFSADHQLILAEGSMLRGEVTLAKGARHFRRNGKLRFLIESVQTPAQESRPLLASLHSVEAGADEHLAVDEEGGAKVENPGSRFVAPTLALLALHATADPGRRGFDNDADDGTLQSPGVGARSIGGFLGWGAIGLVLSQISQPAAVIFAAVGAARSVYSSFLAKGREVSFPADTPIEVRLAPGRSPAR